MYSEYRRYKLSMGTEVEFIDIPKDKLALHHGFGLDIGGSLLKLAYIPKDQSKAKENTVRVEMKAFLRDSLDAAIKFLKDHADTSLTETAYVTGIGSHQMTVQLKEKLGVKKLETLLEMDYFARSFNFLMENFSKSEVLYPPNEKGMAVQMKQLQEISTTIKAMDKFETDISWSDMAENLNEKIEDLGESTVKNDCVAADAAQTDAFPSTGDEKSNSTDQPVKDETEAGKDDKLQDYLPCLLAMCGSGAAYSKIEKDKTYMVADGNPITGRTCLGLGSLLVGTKSFEELISLAEKGDSSNVNTIMKDMKSGKDGDIYGASPDDFMVYSFGKCPNKSIADFKREDLARAVIDMVVRDLAQGIHVCAVATQVKHIFLCGSLVGLSDLIRQEFTAQLGFRCIFSFYTKEQIHIHFVKFGGYLGALGSLITTMEKATAAQK